MLRSFFVIWVYFFTFIKLGVLPLKAETDFLKNFLNAFNLSPSSLNEKQTKALNILKRKLRNKNAIADIVAKASPAVVNLTARHIKEVINPFKFDSFFSPFFGEFLDNSPERVEALSSGSGVVVHPNGLVLTCAHVVKNATSVSLHLNGGSEFDTEIIKIHEQQDLALLKIKNPPKKLPYLKLGDSEKVRIGDSVIAIGNSFGLGQTITHGIISAIRRVVQGQILDQTDAAVNPGNSGGALINMEGELLGLPNAIFSKSGASQGVGFLIPVSVIKVMLDRYWKKEKKSWFGMTVEPITKKLRPLLAEKSIIGGVIISKIHEESQAKKAGLKEGDIIISLNQIPLRHPEDFYYRELLAKVDDEITLKIARSGQEKEIILKVTEIPFYPKPNITKIDDSIPILGNMTIANLSPAFAEENNFNRDDAGVAIIQSPKGGFFQDGDILFTINNKKIQLVKEVMVLLKKDFPKLIGILRKGKKIFFIKEGNRTRIFS